MNRQYKLPFSVMRIFGQDEAWFEVCRTPKFYNVISLWSGGGGKHGSDQPKFNNKEKSLCQERFHDIDYDMGGGMILCAENHLNNILNFARPLYDKDEGLMVHCHAGISRSSAVTFLILLDWLKEKSENPVDEALQLLIAIKPPYLIRPNKYILGLGMHMLAKDSGQEMEWNRILYNHPIFARFYG